MYPLISIRASSPLNRDDRLIYGKSWAGRIKLIDSPSADKAHFMKQIKDIK